VEDRLLLQCTADWLSAPAKLLLPHNGRQFDVCVATQALSPGLHYAEVAAMDTDALWRGPLARVPVTVCVPQPIPAAGASDNGSLPPDGCAAASLRAVQRSPWNGTSAGDALRLHVATRNHCARAQRARVRM
jgi:hypothetical protein